MSDKVCLVLAGVSGSGKSTLSESLKYFIDVYIDNLIIQGIEENCVIACAGDYFMQDGEYKFDASKLGAAHKQCKEKFEKAVEDEISLVIVANTNTVLSHTLPYLKYAEDNGYVSHYICMIPWRKNQKNTNQVPLKTLGKQSAQLNDTIKACHDNFIEQNIRLSGLEELTKLSQEMGLYD